MKQNITHVSSRKKITDVSEERDTYVFRLRRGLQFYKMRSYHLLTTNEPLYGVCHSEDGSVNTCMQVARCLNAGKFLENYTQGYSRR
jgi:hypothetical protein